MEKLYYSYCVIDGGIVSDVVGVGDNRYVIN